MPLKTEETPSRWGAILKTLSNKKAMDVAFLKHQWDMEQEAQQLAGGERLEQIRGQYRMREQQDKDKIDNTPEKQAMAAAMQWARDQALDLQTPEEQAQFQTAYNMFLHQFTGGSKGAMAAATGEPPPMEQQGPIPVGAWDPRRILPGFAHYPNGGTNQMPTGTNLGEPGAKLKTATNPKTGEKLVLRNGKWQKM